MLLLHRDDNADRDDNGLNYFVLVCH